MEDKDYTIDLMEVVTVLKENFKPIIRMTGIVIAVAIAFLIAAWYGFPTYESTALLQVNKSQGNNLMNVMMANFSGGLLNMGGSGKETYVEILKSRTVVVPVIEATEELSFFGKYPRYETYVEKRIDAGILNLTDILEVKVKGETPEKAQKANQLLVERFLKRVVELNSEQKGSLKKFLMERVETAKEDLNKAEIALQKFKEENKILSPSANAQIFTERIMEVEKQAAANKVEQEAAQARLNAINEQLGGSASSSADNVTLQQYNAELAKLETTRIAYRDKYTEKHPRMIELNERIANLKAKIQTEINKVASLQAPSDNIVHQGLVGGKYSAEGAITVARQKGEALQKIIDQNNSELAKMPALEQQYVRLSRDYGVANEVYMLLVKQLEQTKITEFQDPNNLILVDPPHLPDKPTFPRRGVTLILAAILGLFGSSAYVILKEMNNRTIRTSTMIQELADLQVLGELTNTKAFLDRPFNGKEETKIVVFIDKVKEFIWKK